MTASALVNLRFERLEQARVSVAIQAVARLAVNAHDLLLVRHDAGLDARARARRAAAGRRSRCVVRAAIASVAARQSSWPTAPNSSVGTCKRGQLRATLAAPPGMKLSRSKSTTGTGASGEMRATLPQMNWSSITSPTTSTRVFVAADKNLAARAEADKFFA